jgi:hypothetical protein
MKNSRISCLVAIGFITVAHQGSAAVTAGLVAEWLFDGNGNDSSGNGFHAEVTNATQTADHLGVANSAYRFGGSTWAEVADQTSLRSMSSWTLSAWVKPETLTSPYNERIIDKGGDDYSGIAGYVLLYNQNRRFSFSNSWGGGGQGGIESITQVQASEWFFLVGTYDGTTARLYVNGQLEASASMNWTITSTKPVQIGRFEGNINPPHYTSTFFGGIDDVRIYDRAISPSEVTQLQAIPEPSALILGGLTILGCCFSRKR